MAISRFRTTAAPEMGLDQIQPITPLPEASPMPRSPFGGQGKQAPIPGANPSPTSPFGPPVKTPIPGPSPSPTVPPTTGPGGKLPVNMSTGYPALPEAPIPGPSPSPTIPPGTFPLPGGNQTTTSTGQLPPGQQFSPYRVTTDNLNTLLSSNSPYIENARRRGLEQANARGMLNSSIAAGSSQRAAIESAMPILNQIMGLTGQREQQANTSLENQRGRQFEAEMFDRNFNAQLAMLPIASAADMWSGLMQLAASDPTVFTPTVLAGYQDFFQTGFNEYISRYLRPGGG